MLTTNPSINNDPDQNNETIPITNSGRQNVSSSVFRRVTGAFRSRQNPEMREDQGYVEFGGMNPTDTCRTLGTFAGCFAPVSLSMFSALVFIR
jgi:solute carrier family 12 (potassium/chloride transporters), member 9